MIFLCDSRIITDDSGRDDQSMAENKSVLIHGQFSMAGRTFCHSILDGCTERSFTMGTGIRF
jgi:hypothetical protein